MPKELTYNKAFTQLEKLVEQIEDDTIQLDTLAAKVKEANELIVYCEDKLRGIDKEVKSATAKLTTGARSKVKNKGK